MELSFNGEFLEASEKKFQETVVFVPFFGGRKPQLRRHSEFVRDLGFDSVLFDLKFDIDVDIVSPNAGFGMKHVWADQIERVLNEVPGPKILYAFSNPSASAIEAIARRRAHEISGLICDSGPSAKLFWSMVNYFRFEKPVSFRPLRWASALTGTLAWSPDFTQAVHRDLLILPRGFRILSIQGWKDPLIPPDHIDKVFEPHPQIHWTRLGLPQAGHLNGLRDYYDQYVPPVTKFLHSISHPS